jgi:hypothetical protein
MRTNPAVGAANFSAWAAYVVGHHVQTLRLEQEIVWTIRDWVRAEGGYRYSARFQGTLLNVRAALRVLALADQVRVSVLVELHRAIDLFGSLFEEMLERLVSSESDHAIFEEMGHSLTASEREGALAPGLYEWGEVESLTAALLPPSSELRLWSRVGALLGRCRLRLGLQGQPQPEDLAEELKELPGVVAELGGGGKYPILEEVTRFAEAVQGPAGNGPGAADDPTRWYMAFAHLDVQVQSALRGEQVPGPQLVLTRDYLELFGERVDLAGHSEDQVAVLWVLAENANRPVPRETILDQAQIPEPGTNKTFHSIVSRLRSKLLLPLIERYRQREGGRPLPGEDLAFINGHLGRSSSNQQGAYMLQLDASRVQVIGPRPKWMKTATDQ